MARILIIDDEPIIRDVLIETLEREGYETVAASDGNDGIKIHQENPADLIITDLIMPEKEGIETIMELRRDSRMSRLLPCPEAGRLIPIHTFKSPKPWVP